MVLWAALVWLVVALLGLGLVAAGLDVDGLMAAAIAALLMSVLLSVLSSRLTLPLVWQGLGFGSLTVLLVLALRWWSLRRRARAITPSAHAGAAQVISGFDTPDLSRGRVLWKGQSWAAINLEPSRRLLDGETVAVMGRDGTRLQILMLAEPPP